VFNFVELWDRFGVLTCVQCISMARKWSIYIYIYIYNILGMSVATTNHQHYYN